MSLDAYSVLGVHPDAPADDLKAAYEARRLLLHPDRMAGRTKREQDAAAAMLADLQTAWAMVGDARSRARYDAERQPQGSGGGSEGSRPSDPAEPPPPWGTDNDARGAGGYTPQAMTRPGQTASRRGSPPVAGPVGQAPSSDAPPSGRY